MGWIQHRRGSLISDGEVSSWTLSDLTRQIPARHSESLFSLQEGFQNLSLKGTESTILSFLILLIVVGLVGTAGVAAFQPEQWLTYFHLFDESRLVSPLCSCSGDLT